MNITDSKNTWRVTERDITNLATNEIKFVKGIPSANAIARMHEKTFVTRAKIAFELGFWVN